MFGSIIDPHTKAKVSLFGNEGGKLLANYVKVYKHIKQTGGKIEGTSKKKSKKKDTLKRHESNPPNDLSVAVII